LDFNPSVRFFILRFYFPKFDERAILSVDGIHCRKRSFDYSLDSFEEFSGISSIGFVAPLPGGIGPDYEEIVCAAQISMTRSGWENN
jgi:hypothetical protein